MPTIVDTYIKDGETINIYESGAHYNVTRKHLVKAPESAMITKENVHKFKEKLAEKKREAVARGAAKVLERSGEWVTPNALDVIEAISEAVMLKALDPTNPKQVDAARYVTTEMGMAESQTKSSEEAQQFADIAQAVRQLAAFLRGGGEIVDGSAVDMPALTDGGE
jgi:hypothetical protein